jgi:N-acetylglucosamine malate deacetylase 1
VLVLSPHPDDESVGCGGTVHRHVLDGDDVRVVFVTSGEGGGHGSPPDETRAGRRAEAAAAATILGVESFEFWDEPDGSVRATRRLTEHLRGLLHAWVPARIYTPSIGDQHPDHRAVTRLVRRALSVPGVRPRPEVYQYEVWTPLARMDLIVDISDVIDVKLAAIRAHESQCRVLGFDAAFEGLARYRGEMHSWPGGPHAEVFATLAV